MPTEKHRQIERLARGPNPRDRVPVPLPGQRCPRCHGCAPRSDGIPCALCAPEGFAQIFAKALAENLITDAEAVCFGCG
jgi:hypothetical protein